MVGKSFRRSLTFPISRHKSATVSRINDAGSTRHLCLFHPFVSHIADEIHSLSEWSNSHPQRPTTAAWILEGLARLDRLHGCLLGDLLQQPRARESLRPECADSFLDDFLRLADAYSSFRSAIVNLKQEQSATQMAIRRKDWPRITSCLRSQRKTEKEIARIGTGIRSKAGKCAAFHDTAENELVGIVSEVVMVTAAASVAVFWGTVGMSSFSVAARPKAHWIVGPIVRRLASFNHREADGPEEKEKEDDRWTTDALERLEALVECLGDVETAAYKLFRSLINIRVFLLNVLTPLL